MSARIFIPSDPLFTQQWHLLNTGNTEGSVAGFDINVISIWPEYTGRGVLVGVLDDGMDDTHPDLVANYRHDLAWDVSSNQPGASVRDESDEHGVAVAGLIAATANNGIGGVGVAWGASFTMHRLDLEDSGDQDVLNYFRLSAEKMVADGVDISSNSWGAGVLMQQKWIDDYHAVGRYMAEHGREGLGTVALFAGGNDRDTRMNANYDPTDNSPWAIIVGASQQDGGITSYTTPGASILITAPGSGLDEDPPASMVTTDRQGTDGYNEEPGVAGNYFEEFNGTSAATPVAAGVVALMLEANSRLGYRDVQEILAYSAKRATFLDRVVDKAFNGARDWNGGGLLGSHDFGYGNIDAHAAVRLAESWMKLGTVANLVLVDGSITENTTVVHAGRETTLSARFAPNYRVEQMTVTIDIEADSFEGLVIDLISPHGTVSRLFDLSDAPIEDDFHYPAGQLNYTFTTTRSWGEDLGGQWQLKLANTDDDNVIHLKDWSVQAFTAGADNEGAQIFTDEFARFADIQGSRNSVDAANGTTLNAAAVTHNVRFDLQTGVSWIGDEMVSMVDPSGFRNLVSGDGSDVLIGNWASNVIMGGRGNNHIDGGAGVDVARFVGSVKDYTVGHNNDVVTVDAQRLGHGIDVLSNVELLHFNDRVVLTHAPKELGPKLFDEHGYLGQNPDVAHAVSTGQFANGYEHYELWGAHEGRSPNALFDEAWYLMRNPDVAQAKDAGMVVSGLQHYQGWGWTESRAPSAWMDTGAYLAENTDVAAANVDPLYHYLRYGIHEERPITALDVDMWA